MASIDYGLAVVAGSGEQQMRDVVFAECSNYFDREAAVGGRKVKHFDVWKCAQWAVRIVERGDSLGEVQVREIANVCSKLVCVAGGLESVGATAGQDVSGCSSRVFDNVEEVGNGFQDSSGRCGGSGLSLSGSDGRNGQCVVARRETEADGVGIGAEQRSKGGEFVLSSFGDEERLDESVAVDLNKKKGKNWKKNLKARLRRARASCNSGLVEGSEGGSSVSCGGSGVKSYFSSPSGVERSELAASFEDRRIAENRLATQKAEYQFKKNEYMTRSRVVEQQWETERLTCDQKLQKITEARFGTKPGFAETLVSANISSSSLPSMSQGTLSPDSSISVAEVNRMFKLIADLTAQVAQLTVESKAMKETAVLSAYEQRKLEMENMTFEQIAALRGTEKDIRPDGSPVKYDAIGQEIYSECGRPDFMNQYDYRSSITVSEDGQ